MHQLVLIILSSILTQQVLCINFPYEAIQLTKEDIANFPAIDFASSESEPSHASGPKCKAFPGSLDWPSYSDWSKLNETLEGSLLKPVLPTSACYPGSSFDTAKCNFVVNPPGNTRFFVDDAATTLTQWPAGDTCVASLNPRGNCTQGGFPTYVLNVTTVRHVQAGVNFARNKNIRLIIKNTGHDFGGRSLGAGSISIWTHHLKSFEFVPAFTIGEYSGMAVRVGAGVEAWELFNFMVTYNITIVAPGGSTVGVGGGWFAVGGHGALTSFYGLGADQVLSIQVVTADGRFLTADPFTNEDLFYALRGGGGSTYGIVTSVVMKAYPPINMTISTLNFSLSNRPAPNSSTLIPATSILDPEIFWGAFNLYTRFSEKVVDAGGICFNYIRPQGNNTFTFTTSSQFAGLTPSQVVQFMQPLYDDFKRIGLNLSNPRSLTSSPYGSGRPASGATPINTRYRSRLFPRENWQDDVLFNRTIDVIRKSVEAGYVFHGIPHAPRIEIAGWPGRTNAVNPAWRKVVMHASLMTVQGVGLTAEQAKDEEEDIQKYMNLWREAMPESGAYMNEGDPREPNWQQSFYGDNYERLLEIKRVRDPWSVFWARTTVGSEMWEVRSEDGYPSGQNGRLCLADI
ncbi:hypothetical protein BKA61DRAFT_717939 [Leptodontidium sp. MPI-SDFR-AT-0119]|nr:hypothetical protein BKA61DRAFT_717939 [Leptodontidium sp. MPI-SDFR-AT-0119]